MGLHILHSDIDCLYKPIWATKMFKILIKIFVVSSFAGCERLLADNGLGDGMGKCCLA